MFDSLIKFFTRSSSRKHHASTQSERSRGNTNKNENGENTSKHHRKVGNQTRTRDGNNQGGKPSRPEPGRIIQPNDSENLKAMTERVANTIYKNIHRSQKQMDLVILGGLFDLGLKWQKKPHHRHIRFICNDDADATWRKSIGVKVADMLKTSGYNKVWVPDSSLSSSVRKKLYDEALKEALQKRQFVVDREYVRIMPAPLSWRICEALNSEATVETAAHLLKEYIKIYEQNLKNKQTALNNEFKKEREHIRMRPYSGCNEKVSLPMVSINQISEWSREYHFHHAYDNALLVDEHSCAQRQEPNHGHRHLICAPLSLPQNPSSNNPKPRNSSRPPNQTQKRKPRDSSVASSVPTSRTRSDSQSPSKGSRDPTNIRQREEGPRQGTSRRKDSKNSRNDSAYGGSRERSQSLDRASPTRPPRQHRAATSTPTQAPPRDRGRPGIPERIKPQVFKAGDELEVTPPSTHSKQDASKITSSRTPSRPSRAHNPERSSRGGDRRARTDSAHSRAASREPEIPMEQRRHQDYMRQAPTNLDVDNRNSSRSPHSKTSRDKRGKHDKSSHGKSPHGKSPHGKSPHGKSPHGNSPHSAVSDLNYNTPPHQSHYDTQPPPLTLNTETIGNQNSDQKADISPLYDAVDFSDHKTTPS
ncbi:hypothetical protein ACMFMF_009645 [Clarireedia jacksonii]